jgi:hypothetical protein
MFVTIANGRMLSQRNMEGTIMESFNIKVVVRHCKGEPEVNLSIEYYPGEPGSYDCPPTNPDYAIVDGYGPEGQIEEKILHYIDEIYADQIWDKIQEALQLIEDENELKKMEAESIAEEMHLERLREGR